MRIALADLEIFTDRQRSDFGDIDGLADSMRRIGQISPVAVEPLGDGRYRLIAGERRCKAATKLGWTYVEALELRELDPRERELVELEENVRRKQLSWPEEIAAVEKYVTIAKEPRALSAKSLGLSEESLSQRLTLAEAIQENPKLKEIPTWTAAYTQHTASQKRAMEAAMESLLGDNDDEEDFKLFEDAEEAEDEDEDEDAPVAPKVSLAPKAPAPPRTSAFRAENNSFLNWAPNYSGERFNFIHCDFPYGVGMDSNALMNTSHRWKTIEDRYEDDPDIFDRLVRTFFEHQDKFIATSAHCLFWLAHKNYGRIASRFAHFGWSVCETPIIWHKTDNAGIAPDPRRWPRRTYEIAIFASRDDRKIVKVKAASFGGPATKEHHISEKPMQMLSHFFEMVVDQHTTILDPTCGSGTALRVAKSLGAAKGLGLDVMDEHVAWTNKKLGE